MNKEDIKRHTRESRVYQFATFQIAARLFGVDILAVREISNIMRFTPVFHACEEIRGFVNIRGQIHLVIDLGRLLGFGESRITDSTRIVIFKPHVGESFAVMVDKIGDVEELAENLIEHSRIKEGANSENLNIRSDLYGGFCKLKENILVILEPEKLLPALNTAA